MDIFCECMVKKKRGVREIIATLLITTIALGATAFLVFAFLMGESFYGTNLLMLVGIWWGYIRFIGGLFVEYEYTLTNNELDIDIIKAKSRRKHIATVNIKELEFFCNRSNSGTEELLKRAGSVSKEYYFVGSRKSKNIYVTDVISKRDGSKIRVNIEPDAELLRNIRLVNPKAVILEEKNQ